MSDLSASHCGCNSNEERENRCCCNGSLFGGNSNSWIWIIILLFSCNGCNGSGLFSGNRCGCDCDDNCGCNNSWIWIIILLFFCGGCGNNNGCC